VKTKKAAKIVATAGLTWSVLMSIALVFLPLYSGSTVNSAGLQALDSTETLIEVNGYQVLYLLLIPILLTLGAALPIIRNPDLWGVRWAVVWIGASMLLVFVVLASFTIGIFYLPAALLIIAAAVLAEIKPRKTAKK
jgi:hypothetical protein